MKYLVLVLVLISNYTFSQQIDYNTKKGFVVNGYDVVAYFNNAPREGSEEFTTKHDGVNYKFSSKENLETFKRTPEKFIPQYGGYCAYAVGEKSKKVGVNPETYEIKDGKLYLFYNAWGTNTLELWNEKNTMKGLQKKADQNWELIKFN
jgi:YHS domain-containing protein